MTLIIIAALVCDLAVLAIVLAQARVARRKFRRHKLNLLEDLSARRRQKP